MHDTFNVVRNNDIIISVVVVVVADGEVHAAGFNAKDKYNRIHVMYYYYIIKYTWISKIAYFKHVNI